MNTQAQNDQILAQIAIANYKTNHILHLLLTLLSGGLWGLVWVLKAASNAGQRGKISRKLASNAKQSKKVEKSKWAKLNQVNK
jgi:hypothetical protein